MSTNVVELADRIRSQAATQLILCRCTSPTPADGTAWVWVFRESDACRLERLWAGVLDRAEGDRLADQLSRGNPLWLGGIDCRHAPPSRRFRLVLTLPPAPCRIYTRRGLAVEAGPAFVTRHDSRRCQQQAVRPVSHVEGWIGPDWTYAGITVKGPGNEAWEVIRLKNEGPFIRFLLAYDGIDLMMDTAWLDSVVPRVAEVLGVAWKIVDYTDTPPAIVRQSGPPAAQSSGALSGSGES